jgi:hypothetical protein
MYHTLSPQWCIVPSFFLPEPLVLLQPPSPRSVSYQSDRSIASSMHSAIDAYKMERRLQMPNHY